MENQYSGAEFSSENQEDTFSIVMKTKFDYSKIRNSILDSGSGVSVMDLGTYESLSLKGEIKNFDKTEVYRDASDNIMDILGTTKIIVQICGTGKQFHHDFYILNQRTFRNVILGRDLMRTLKRVTLDFEDNWIQLDGCRTRGSILLERRLLDI